MLVEITPLRSLLFRHRSEKISTRPSAYAKASADIPCKTLRSFTGCVKTRGLIVGKAF